MTLGRRVSAIETDNNATERVLRWLAEAHAYDSIEDYADRFIDEGEWYLPLDRLPREAIAAIRGRRGPRTRDVEAEIRETLRALVFRIHLVLRIQERVVEILDREPFVHASLVAYMCLALELEGTERAGWIKVTLLRDLLLIRVTELLAVEEAQRRAEAQYLDGSEALFPGEARRWKEQVFTVQQSAMMAMRLVELDGGLPIDEQHGTEPTEARIEACYADLVEVARIKALADLGDGHASIARTRRWLAGKRVVIASP